MKNKSFKKIIAFSLASYLSLSTSIYANTNGSVKADVLNVRSEPSISSTIVSKAYYGQQVSIVSKENEWYKIQLSSGYAYVHGDYIEEDANNQFGKVTVNILNIRNNPSINSSIIDKAYYGEKLQILNKENEWYKIESNLGNAYVHSDYIEVLNTTANSTGSTNNTSLAATSDVQKGTVTASILNLRSTPNIANNNKIGSLKYYEQVTILNEDGDWYNVRTTDGKEGYVSKQYIVKGSNNTTELRQNMINYGMQFLGNPYVFGGTSLTNGIDCSSFTQQIYAAFGYKINRTSYTQINNGVRISVNELLPGDLIFYGYNGVISHVAMFIGDGKILHASSPSTGIIISSMYSSKPLIGAVRIIQ